MEHLPTSGPYLYDGDDSSAEVEDEDDLDELRGEELCFICATFYHYAKQIPPRHSRQQKLLLLLYQVRTAPDPTNIPDDMTCSNDHAFWPQLPLLWWTFNRHEYFTPAYPPRVELDGKDPRTELADVPYPERKTITAEEWTNLNSSVANVHGMTNGQVSCLDHLALYALVDALEEELDGAKVDDLLPSAAEWILGSGKLLRENRKYYNSNGWYITGAGMRSLYNPGPLWDAARPRFSNDERRAFCMER
ncbi:MAG: hypothetical protein M1831_003324 [Alyxoria varia]|nr:MAG: hypothetical protein M1831_003324 [Alyxoria varia]